METFIAKRGDRSPSLVATLTDDLGSGPVEIDLAGKTVKFRMRPLTRNACGQSELGAYKVEEQPAIVISGGKVQYDWGVSDLDTVGRFAGEFRVYDADGLPETYPDAGYIPIVVNP